MPGTQPRPLDLRRVIALVDKHAAGRESLVRAVMAKASRRLNQSVSRDFYTAEGQRRLAAELAALDRIAATTYANQTVAYLNAVSRQVREPTPRVVEPLPRRPRGVDPVEQWLRPFEQFRYEYAKSSDEAAARGALLRRVELNVADDVALGMRIAARNHGQAARTVTGFRRVVHPEQSRGGSCGLCLVASDQVYARDSLMPLHNGCNCGVAEIFNGADPGNSLNGRTLQDLYGEAGGTGRQELQRVRVAVEQHDELGPLLIAA